MTAKAKFLVYCGLTCMGGSEKRECACEHPNDCEMRTHPEFEEYHRQAGVRLFRAAAAIENVHPKIAEALAGAVKR